MVSPTPPHVCHSWETCATGNEEQGRLVTMEVPRLRIKGALTVCRASPEVRRFPLSQRVHAGISPCQDIKDKIITSCLMQLIDTRPLYSSGRSLREPREVERHEQRSTDVPECEKGRGHLHPGNSSGK